jgi:hypothetical protein
MIGMFPKAEYKEKHCEWDPIPELTITSPHVQSRVDSNTFTMGNPMPESTLSPSQGLWIWLLEHAFPTFRVNNFVCSNTNTVYVSE